MKKLILVLLLLCGATVVLFGFEISIPNEIPAYKNLEVTMTMDKDVVVEEARLYFLQPGKKEPLYAVFTDKDGVWNTVIPYPYLLGQEFLYYVQVLTKDGKLIRNPASGTNKARLLQDVTPPSLTLIAPEKKTLVKGKEQLVVFKITDESGISDFDIVYNGVPLKKAGVFKDMLSFLITPANDKNSKATVSISMVDYFKNKAKQDFTFPLIREAQPFFSAKTEYTANLSAKYTMEMGETANTTDFGALFADIQNDLTIDFELGGKAKLKAGPLALELAGLLADSVSAVDIPVAYPNTLVADFQNIMNLWNPWNFANEFDYTGEVARKAYNLNKMYAKLSILDPILSYTFGDQKISFQKETIKDFEFRGSGLSLKIPLINLSVNKGLSDLGLYQEAWPQNFFGLQAGINAFDYWWLQTNLSFISSLQGPYDTIAASGESAIGTLYDLGSIKPEENLVIGLGTGTDNKLFKLSGGFGLSLYTDDASKIIDKNKLATDINDGFNFDISPYLDYVDMVTAIFPVFDYFPLTDGLIVNALNRDLWGITYGGDLEVPLLGVLGWFHKTDGSYKSLGASVDTDVMDWGASWDKSLWDFDFSLSYDWQKDNIPDILFTDILPLIVPSLASTADPTTDDISNITHTGDLSIDTPSAGLLGNATLTYTFEWATTNAAQLAASITDDATAKSAIENSTLNDTTMTNTAGLQWKSGRIQLGNFLLSLGAKTEDSYINYLLIDGAESASTAWEFLYGADTTLQYDRYRLNLAFEHSWSTAAATDVTYGYDAKFTILKGFFDQIAIDCSFDPVYNSSIFQKYGIGAGLKLSKRFGKFDTNATINVGYINSLVDDSYDALTSAITISGGISL